MYKMYKTELELELEVYIGEVYIYLICRELMLSSHYIGYIFLIHYAFY